MPENTTKCRPYTKEEDCTGCSACSHICPTNSISMVPDRYGFLYPCIDVSTCISCGLCEEKCPIKNLVSQEQKIKVDAPAVYAAKHKNQDVRSSSSSGGVFTAVSDAVLNQGGMVAGAAFDKNLMVCHRLVDSKKERDYLKGSKYVQSVLGDVFVEIGHVLSSNRTVLFSGTPCQVAGLYAFLGKNPENLYTVDVICHGVPSPKVFSDYKEFLLKKFRQSKIMAL